MISQFCQNLELSELIGIQPVKGSTFEFVNGIDLYKSIIEKLTGVQFCRVMHVTLPVSLIFLPMILYFRTMN